MKTHLLFALSLVALSACACMEPCCTTGSGKTGGPTLGTIIRKDPRFDALIPPGARMEILSGGYEWCEGPLWIKDGGYLLFSVIPGNKVCKWKEGEGVSIYLRPSGLTGPKDLRPEPGSNGLILDPSAGMKVTAHHADIQIGPAGSDLRPSGTGATITATRHQSQNTCEAKFVPFPEGGARTRAEPRARLEGINGKLKDQS